MNFPKKKIKYIYRWLIVCCFMVFAMIVIGGLTRLTDSGLSMVEWKLLYGILPPFSTSDWIELFNNYKQYPEYKLINKNLSLEDFKFIFWMEYFHRIWGRLIFLVFFIPLIIFLKKKYIPLTFHKHFFAIFLLILIQGFFGWYMVKSGLLEEPDVSHYRLATHLTLAFVIYGYFLFLTFKIYDLIYEKKKLILGNRKILKLNLLLITLILITVFSGGMVAGLDAGLVYNTFPLMGESLVPHDIWQLSPKFLNFFENPVTVQFDHRILGILTCILVSGIWIFTIKNNLPKEIKTKATILLFVVIIQIGLGIATLISYVAIPIAITHQSGALILYTISIWILKNLPLVSK